DGECGPHWRRFAGRRNPPACRTSGRGIQCGSRGADDREGPAGAGRRARRSARVRGDAAPRPGRVGGSNSALRRRAVGRAARGRTLMTTTPTEATAARQATLVDRGRRVIRLECEALVEVGRRPDERFAHAVELIASSTGRVLVAGVGKSGIIGRKIAATFTSTGTPATFLHPVDSVHGDLGIVGHDDIAILIWKSGETDELVELLQHLKRFGVRSIALTGVADSTLGRHADVALDAWVREEACPHDLAPTTSTTAALAIGDALAVALLEEKGFRREDFALIHPGGSLGRQLLTRVDDV